MKLLLYIGTYTDEPGQGICACDFDPVTGRLEMLGLAAQTAHTLFLAAHPAGRILYSAGQIRDHQDGRAGVIRAFSVDESTGRLTLINQQLSQGTIPCYVAVDRLGKNVALANYGSGSVAVFRLAPDGSVTGAPVVAQHAGSGFDPKRQDGPHPHAIPFSPDNRFAIVTDLGLDRIFIYPFDPASGALTVNNARVIQTAPGAGPRHFAFHPGGRFGYVVNELDSTVTTFAYEAAGGGLEKRQTISILPDGFHGHNIAAEVQVHQSGRFLYASNRGCDCIAVLGISPGEGTLTLVGHVASGGKTPCHFAMDPTGSWLVAVNQHSDSVVVFRIDPKSGALTPASHALALPSPVCVVFLKPLNG